MAIGKVKVRGVAVDAWGEVSVMLVRRHASSVKELDAGFVRA